MTTVSQSTKRKLSLLQLAEELGNVSRACKIMGCASGGGALGSPENASYDNARPNPTFPDHFCAEEVFLQKGS
ncbi:MAG: hypothetical protein JJU06_02270 [Ectothiorhodospiraceae bacterium]|nr:hypothetical protein [Ectothiorhodospiraceae bacterium]MCH8504896.1 hypothetical protein [Ectothiorhodospiraceae bacterium]